MKRKFESSDAGTGHARMKRETGRAIKRVIQPLIVPGNHLTTDPLRKGNSLTIRTILEH